MINLSTMQDLGKYGLKDTKAFWNLSPQELQKITIEKGMADVSWRHSRCWYHWYGGRRKKQPC